MSTSQTRFQTLMPIKTKGALPPLFCVHGEPLKMAMRIKADRPVYGLSHVYHASFQDTVADSIEELARQYLDDVYKAHAEAMVMNRPSLRSVPVTSTCLAFGAGLLMQ